MTSIRAWASRIKLSKDIDSLPSSIPITLTSPKASPQTCLHGPPLLLRSSLSLYFFVPAHLPHYKKVRAVQGQQMGMGMGEKRESGRRVSRKRSSGIECDSKLLSLLHGCRVDPLKSMSMFCRVGNDVRSKLKRSHYHIEKND